MKRTLHIFAILASLLTLSCARELVPEEDPSSSRGVVQEGATVTLRFGVEMPDPVTKTLGDQPEITSLYVAVFGSSGYLKEYVKATPVDDYVSVEGESGKQGYAVNLSLTASKIRVHFIANGPESLDFGYEAAIMAKLSTTSGIGSYWQRILLNHGIYALDDEGSHATPPVYTIDPDFDLDDDDGTTHKMALVPLIRNFAKIAVEAADTSNLVVTSFAVLNVPDKGSVAPYNATTGEFMMDYQSYGTLAAMSAAYPGNLPSDASIDTSAPTEDDFTNLTNGVVSSTGSVYMYERPVPTSDATILILKGTYTDPDTNEQSTGYYKIDMMEGSEYLPILRNFRYLITIKKVYRKGKTTVAGAINGAGSADISADVSTATQTNISDGSSSIAVSYTDRTLAIGGTYTLGVSFVPDVSTGTVDNSLVTYELLEAGSTGAVIDSESDISFDSTLGTLTYTTTEVDATNTKVQKIRVIGTSGTSRLYRDITIRLLPKQTMTVSCISEINAAAGTSQVVTVSIPQDLPQSIFPLQFKVEVANKTLTPNASDLPVEAGETIVTGSSGNSYYFVKTISYSDYLAAYTGSVSTFTCSFKSIVAVSDSDIYVANDYFHTASTSFTTYTKRYFTPLAFSTSTAANEDDPVDFTFYLDLATENEDDKLIPSTVDVYLTGLVPDGTQSDVLAVVSGTHYLYTVPSGSSAYTKQTLHLVSTGETSEYAVSLSATHYEDASKVNTTAYYSVSTTAGDYGWTSYTSAPDGYTGYRSNNYNVSSSIATMSVTVVGYTEFTIYIRSYAESTYDYVVVRNIGADALTSWTAGSAYSDSGTKVYTRGNQQSGTTIGSYTAVTFTTSDGLTDDSTPHTFYIQYGKDNRTDSGDDRGYVLIPSEYNYTYVPVSVTGVSLDKTSASVKAGGTLQLTATVTPTNADDRSVTWTSSNTSVATVSSSGLVTVSSSASEGSTAVITVTTTDGSYTATCTITVVNKTWKTGTYTVTMNTAATYSQTSYSDGTSGITVTCTNTSGGTGGGGGGSNSYYKRIGTTNAAGTLAISAAGSSLEDCALLGATITYYSGGPGGGTTYNQQTVTADTGTISNSYQTWTASSTDEGEGDESVTISMASTYQQNNLNRVTQMVITYGYYE